MNFDTFIRRPFTVEALRITEENIEEIAELVGTLQQKDDGTHFIAVDRKKVPNVITVFPGYYLTRMGKNIRCYKKKVFEDQFIASNPLYLEWLEAMNASSKSEELPQPAVDPLLAAEEVAVQNHISAGDIDFEEVDVKN